MGRIVRIAVFGVALSAAPAWAQVYKWVDEQGRTHYGEKPPASKGAPVNLRDATGGPRPDAGQDDLQRQEREFQQRQRDRVDSEERQRLQGASRSSSENVRNCRLARNDVAIMDRFSTSYTFDQRAEARHRVSRYCR
jgi:hypothetical protein